MSVIVFLGPSFPIERARRELPDATFLPPARRGDIYRVVRDRDAVAIGLIDGLFDSVPAVVHKEILFALSQGTRVFGAASMGALRAAELWQFGMEGIGSIFERYKTGVWDADDEVAVTHGPVESGFAPGSCALANLRLGLEAAQRSGAITSRTAGVLCAEAAAQFYADRSWEALYELGTAAGLPRAELEALRAFVTAEEPDAKRDDALALLRRMRTLIAAGLAPACPTFEFEETIFWKRLVSESARIVTVQAGEEVSISPSALRRHLQVRPESRQRLRGAVLLHFLQREARWRTDAVSQRRLNVAISRFRRRKGLHSSAQTRTWLSANGMTQSELVLLAKLDLVLEDVQREAASSIAGLLPLELKRRGELGEVTALVARKQRSLEEAGVSNLALHDTGTSLAQLMGWYQDHYESIEGPLDEHATALGFESVREFLSEVLLDHRVATEDQCDRAVTAR
jgi:hypothetical protein